VPPKAIVNGAPFFRKTKAMLLGATRLYPEGEGEEMSLRYPSLFSINCLINIRMYESRGPTFKLGVRKKTRSYSSRMVLLP
jgi:hypothetical protein